MKHNLHPDYFFNLSAYAHADLFSSETHVWLALAKIQSYLKSCSLGKIDTAIPEGAFLVDAHLISIGKGTVIEPGAYIKGPCIIGQGCSVRHGAYIRGDVIVGDNCVIGHDTEIKHSIMLDNAHAAHFAYVGDSILGNRVNLGAGTKCANLKLDNAKIIIRYENESFETGLRKFGLICGDDTQIGCNTVTNPGTLLGQGVLCYPCMNFGGFVPSRSIVKTNVQIKILTR